MSTTNIKRKFFWGVDDSEAYSLNLQAKLTQAAGRTLLSPTNQCTILQLEAEKLEMLKWFKEPHKMIAC
jgi:hypothetical protein